MYDQKNAGLGLDKLRTWNSVDQLLTRRAARLRMLP